MAQCEQCSGPARQRCRLCGGAVCVEHRRHDAGGTLCTYCAEMRYPVFNNLDAAPQRRDSLPPVDMLSGAPLSIHSIRMIGRYGAMDVAEISRRLADEQAE